MYFNVTKYMAHIQSYFQR